MPEELQPVIEDFSWITEFCNQPLPIAMTRILRTWLVRHFSQPTTIENQTSGRGLTSYIWRPDHTTGIIIEPAYKWAPQVTENRPAILISRLDWQRLHMGLDDRYQDYDKDIKGFLYECWWRGQHLIYCISNEGGEAELLAVEVAREINQFSPIIRQMLHLPKFSLASIGKVSKLEEARENWSVPIIVDYVVRELWQLKPVDEASGQTVWPFAHFWDVQP